MLKKYVVLFVLGCMLISTICFGGDDDLPIPIYSMPEYTANSRTPDNSPHSIISNYQNQ